MSGELLLVGSIPCETAEDTFRTFGPALGEYLSYIPDGEVGDRRYWIDFIAYKVFNGHPDLEVVKRPEPDAQGVEQWRSKGLHDQFKFRVKNGVSKVRFGDPGWRIGYARDAANSYAIFKLLKQQGVLPRHLKLQVCLPLTYSAVQSYFDEEDVPKVIPGFSEALRLEIEKIVELIPAEELAIQWDLAVEERLVDLALPQGEAAAKREALRVMEPAKEICAAIPRTVALGHHMCFGTLNGWPSRPPKDLTGAVLLANAAVESSGRPVDFVHIPTLGSADEEFFRPLAQLKTAGAKVYMGAIHHLHKKGGLRDQVQTMNKYLPKFGLAAPCGFGRAPERPGKLLSDSGEVVPDYIDVIIKDHRDAVSLLSS